MSAFSSVMLASIVYIFCVPGCLERNKYNANWPNYGMAHVSFKFTLIFKPLVYGVRPGATRQFVAGGLGRTGTNREGIRVRSYISGSATDRTRFGAKRSVPVMLRFTTVHSRCSSGVATICPGESRYATALTDTCVSM